MTIVITIHNHDNNNNDSNKNNNNRKNKNNIDNNMSYSLHTSQGVIIGDYTKRSLKAIHRDTRSLDNNLKL